MNILILDKIGNESLSLFQKQAPSNFFINCFTDNDSINNKLLKEAHILVSKKVKIDKQFIENSPNLKFIQLMTNRSDKIDKKILNDKKIKVSLLPQVGCIAVAELAMTLILSLSKKIPLGHNYTKNAEYLKMNIEPFKTEERKHNFQWMKIPNLFEINGKSLGIVGFGEIGTELARRATSFGMIINYFSRTQLSKDIEEEEGINYQKFDELLSSNDFISLHLPHTNESEKMINKRTISLMKKDSYIINTSRGGIIDEDDLVSALKNNQIAGAALDVFLYEPLPAGHSFMKLDNIILSPHIGGGSGGARIKHVENLLNNILKFQNTGKPDYEISN